MFFLSNYLIHFYAMEIVHYTVINYDQSHLEPSSLYCADGKYPDGVTMVKGKLLVWNEMCPDTFAPSYILASSKEVRAFAAVAEVRTAAKHLDLQPLHLLLRVAIESMRVSGPQTTSFLLQLG